jgi:hypothetical protein
MGDCCMNTNTGNAPRHFICLDCRKQFKIFKEHRHKNNPDGSWSYDDPPQKCPQCTIPMTEVGKNFKPPGKHQISQWKKVKLLLDNGFKFTTHHGRYPRKYLIPNTIGEVKAILKQSALRTYSDRGKGKRGSKLLPKISKDNIGYQY